MNKDAASSAQPRRKSFAHVAEASWGKGLSTLLRITRMTLRHPWQVAITIVSTFIAATLQLFIPRLLGHAVDQAQGVIAAGAGAAAERALWTTALMLLVVSIAARPLHDGPELLSAKRSAITPATSCAWRSTRRSSA